MIFELVKTEGERVFREFTDEKDIRYYKNSPRWKEISDEEYEKAIEGKEPEVVKIPDEDKESKIQALINQGFSRQHAEKALM